MFTLKKKPLSISLAMGLLLGIVSVFSPGSLFCILIVLLIGLSISFISDRDERLFLSRLFFWGVASRVLLVLTAQFTLLWLQKWTFYEGGDRAIVLFGDDGFNNIVGWWIAQYVLGKELSDYLLLAVSTSTLEVYGRSGYLYLVSLFHYLFGYSPISVIFINCIISVLTGTTYYFIAKKLTDIRTAKITFILVTFFPSLIIWSIASLKDSLFIFLTGFILFLFLKILEARKIKYFVLLILSLILQFSIRKWVLFPTVLILSLSYALIKKKIKIIHVFFAAVVLMSGLFIFKDKLQDYKLRTVAYHVGVISSGGSVYHIYDDRVYTLNYPLGSLSYLEVLKGSFAGWVNFFLQPFPWNISSNLSLAALPQMFLWYFLIFFSIIGALIQLRDSWSRSIVFVLYFITVGTIFSFTGGNIGTDFRMRDMLTPIVLVFSSVGLIRAFCPQPGRIV